jgi:hypothetical protein
LRKQYPLNPNQTDAWDYDLRLRSFGLSGLSLLVPWKRWTDDVERHMKILGIRHWHTWARDQKEWGRIALEDKDHN